MKFLFIGDIVGKAGRQAALDGIVRAKREFSVEFVVANGENIAHGFGITLKTASELFAAGVNVMTSGNHIWDKKEVVPLLIATAENAERAMPILRPLNLPLTAPGTGVFTRGEIAIVNLMGMHNMGVVENAFNMIESAVEELRSRGIKTIIVDFHAETSAEKNALLKLLEARVSFIFGTHTHIGTDDLLIARGTGYVSDVGLTGVRDQVIGMGAAEPLSRYKTGVKSAFEVVENSLIVFQGVVADIDPSSGECLDAFKIRSFDRGEFLIAPHAGGWR
ncbi:MAG: YmdB family metallophosphoesterase [Helicobacteraceae bacterium]|jgi:metallophosphoesterase (TIGR00282 family)|nr:YmdB family metallophosphoesterase [Helicobacteraceae bacterium]